MRINLGLVRLGGDIDIPEPIDGYIFNFSSKEPQALEIRGYWNMNQLFESLNECPEVRLMVNYHDDATIAVGIKLLHMFSYKISTCYVLFDTGQAMKLF